MIKGEFGYDPRSQAEKSVDAVNDYLSSGAPVSNSMKQEFHNTLNQAESDVKSSTPIPIINDAMCGHKIINPDMYLN